MGLFWSSGIWTSTRMEGSAWHNMMLPALFRDWLAVYKSLLLFCRGGTGSGNSNDQQSIGALIWPGSKERVLSACTWKLMLWMVLIRTLFWLNWTVYTCCRSTFSTILSQSNDVVQYVDYNPGKVDAYEKRPIGGYMTCLYSIALTGYRLDMRHWWQSSGIHVIFQSQPSLTIACHKELQGTTRPKLYLEGTVCVPEQVRPRFHGHYWAQAHRRVGHWVEFHNSYVW